MESVWDYLSELQSYWVTISTVMLLLLTERMARRWLPFYGPWAQKENRGRLLAVGFVLIAAMVLGFSAWRGEHRKNVAAAAVVVGVPGTVYNINGINAITAYLGISNYGQTLATETSWEVGVRVQNLGAGAGPFDGLGEPQLQQGPENIPPGESVPRHPEFQWPSEAVDRDKMVTAIKRREKGIFVFGRINYTDKFGETWGSGFCRIYSGPNTLPYRDQDDTPRELYPNHEYVPCPNPDLNYGPRKISKP